ncbi:MAG TPA: DoxX family protein [Euzebya sp.]|nr:DoxX family protein [Euzebya sp.]
MSLLRHAARTLLASVFIADGIDAVRNPAAKVEAAGDTHRSIAQHVSAIPADDPEMLVRTTGALQVAAGMGLVTDNLTRSSALALAATMVPTLGEHRFWEEEGTTRSTQLRHFLKDLGLLGGLLVVAMDTEGKPGPAWMTGYAVRRANELADHKREILELRGELAKEKARAATAGTRARVQGSARQVRRDAKVARKIGRGAGHGVASAGRGAKRAVKAMTPG